MTGANDGSEMPPFRGRSGAGMRRGAMIVAALTLIVGAAPGARAAVTSVDSTLAGVQGDAGARRITYVGVSEDRADLRQLHLGTAGYWFPQFAAPGAVDGAPTGANARDALPAWVAAFNHTTGPADPGCTEPDAARRGCVPTYYFRTFSQDGPARSSGGIDAWSRLRLPDGECGGAGAIVDPQTFVAPQEVDDPTGLVSPRTGSPKPNNNNTINRIQLQDGVPSTFFVGVVTDATAGDHDPDRLEVRGNVGMLDVPSQVANSQIEATFDTPLVIAPNGVPDVYLFRIDGFTSGDYLKLRLRGATAAASFSGLLFDEGIPTHGRQADTGEGRPRGARGCT